MILIDGNNLTRRYLHVAIGETMKDLFTKDYDGRSPDVAQLQEFKALFMHFVLNEILEMKSKYGRNYGKVVIAFDSNNPWRRRVYAGYKSNRSSETKSKADMMQDQIFYWALPALVQILKATDFTIIDDLRLPDGYGIEADDVIGILAVIEKSVVCSCDVDFTQLLNDNVKQYHPFRRALLETPSKKDVEMWKQFNIISGQAKDGIPGIMQHCKLSPEFISWVNSKFGLEIDGTMIEKIESDHKELMKQYEVEMALEDEALIKNGTRKKRKNLSAYEKPRGGETMVLKFLADFDTNMKTNPRWKAHYERNADLLLFERIPQDVRDVIIAEAKKEPAMMFFNTLGLQSLLLENRLYKIADRISEF